MPNESLVSRVLYSLRDSCFGSDELQAYTATYSWLANQMSHVAMGFFLAIAITHITLPAWRCFNWMKKLSGKFSWLKFWVPYLIPTVKLPLDWLVIKAKSGAFEVPWEDFWDDKVTDLGFWFLGMLLAHVFITAAYRRVLIVLFVVLVGIGVWNYSRWTEQKGAFDRSGLPSGWIRVCEYNTVRACPDEKTRTTMEGQVRTYTNAIRSGQTPVVHCVIRGGGPTNRSDLAAAFGTEFATRRKPIYYFTANRLLERADELDRWQRFTKPGSDGKYCQNDPVFPRCVIIDDLPADYPPPNANHAVPVAIDNPYDTSANSQRTFNWFAEHRDKVSTIWVLCCDPAYADSWLNTIRNYACWNGKEKKEEAQYGTKEEREQRVIDIDLGKVANETIPATSPPAIPRDP